MNVLLTVQVLNAPSQARHTLIEVILVQETSLYTASICVFVLYSSSWQSNNSCSCFNTIRLGDVAMLKKMEMNVGLHGGGMNWLIQYIVNVEL